MSVFTLNTIKVEMYVSPVVWNGDPVGHVGENDSFFYVVKGECYIRIDSESFLVKEGELALLPKGRNIAYSTANKDFSMYSVDFDCILDGQNWFEALCLGSEKYHVCVDEPEYIASLFEKALKKKEQNDKTDDIVRCSSLAELIEIYVVKRREQDSVLNQFKDVIDYIENNIAKSFRIDELAEIAGMKSSGFIKKFKASFGETPITYINKMKMFKAMSILASTDCSVEKAGETVGIADSSYFAKLFRQHCFTTPAEYRKLFKKFTNEYMF